MDAAVLVRSDRTHPSLNPHRHPVHAGSFGSVRLARRIVPGEEADAANAKQYAVKALSKQRLRRMKKSVLTGADGRMVVKTGEDMVRPSIREAVCGGLVFVLGVGVGFFRVLVHAWPACRSDSHSLHPTRS